MAAEGEVTAYAAPKKVGLFDELAMIWKNTAEAAGDVTVTKLDNEQAKDVSINGRQTRAVKTAVQLKKTGATGEEEEVETVVGYVEEDVFNALDVSSVSIPQNFAGLENVCIPTKLQYQLFRIVEVNEEDDGVTIKARHVWYDNLQNHTLWTPDAETAYTAAAVCRNILTNAISPTSSHVASDCTDTMKGGYFDFERKNLVECFLDPESGVCSKFDLCMIRYNWDFYCLKNVGYDRGIVIQDKKNLLGVERTESIENLITRIAAYGKDTDGNIVWLNNNGKKYIDSPYIADYGYPRVEVYDTGVQVGKDDVTDGNLQQKILQKAQEHFTRDKVDIPVVSMDIDFISLGDTEEYKQYRDLDKVFLYDIISVKETTRGYSYQAQVVGVEHNLLTGRLEKVTIGELMNWDERRKIAAWQVPEINGALIRERTIHEGSFADNAVRSGDIQSAAVTSRHLSSNAQSKVRELALEQIVVENTSPDGVINTRFTVTEGQIRGEISDTANGLRSSITQTASQIRSEMANTASGLYSSITQEASQIRSEVHNATSSLYSTITQTESQIRSEVANTASGLYSKITQEASQIRSEVSATENRMHSSITQEASQIRAEVESTAQGLATSITQTASQIRSEAKDSENRMKSSITQEASQIRSEVHNATSSLYSAITQTESQIRSEVANTASGLYSSITQEASQIRAEVSDSVNGLSSSITQTASQIRSEVSDSVNGLSSSITQTASQIRSEVSDSVNGLNSSITQTASQIRSEVSNTASGLYSSITQTASQIRTEVSTAISGVNSSITQTASQIRSEVNNAVSGLQSSITQESNRISLVVEGTGSSASVKRAVIQAAVTDDNGKLVSSITMNADQVYIGNQTSTTVINGKCKLSDVTASHISTQLASLAQVTVNGLNVVGDVYVRNASGQQQNLANAIWTLDISQSGNTYTLRRKRYNDSDWVDIGSFSRAVTSISKARSGGKYTFTPQPQGSPSVSIGFNGNPDYTLSVDIASAPTASAANDAFIDASFNVMEGSTAIYNFTKTLNATPAYNKGKTAGANGVTISSANWASGKFTVTLSNGKSVNTDVYTGGHWGYAAGENTKHYYGSISAHKDGGSTAISTGASFEIDGSSIYSAGETAGYTSGYTAGSTAGASGVSISSANWSGGKFTVTLSNGKSVNTDVYTGGHWGYASGEDSTHYYGNISAHKDGGTTAISTGASFEIDGSGIYSAGETAGYTAGESAGYSSGYSAGDTAGYNRAKLSGGWGTGNDSNKYTVSKSTSGVAGPLNVIVTAGITYDSNTHKYTATAYGNQDAKKTAVSGTEAYQAGITDGRAGYYLPSDMAVSTAYSVSNSLVYTRGVGTLGGGNTKYGDAYAFGYGFGVSGGVTYMNMYQYKNGGAKTWIDGMANAVYIKRVGDKAYVTNAGGSDYPDSPYAQFDQLEITPSESAQEFTPTFGYSYVKCNAAPSAARSVTFDSYGTFNETTGAGTALAGWNPVYISGVGNSQMSKYRYIKFKVDGQKRSFYFA